jgi:hypothetical protein
LGPDEVTAAAARICSPSHTGERDHGYEVRDEDVARLSPYMRAHINVHGHYSFAPLNLEAGIGNRPLRNPAAQD